MWFYRKLTLSRAQEWAAARREESGMPALSAYAQRKKIEYFLAPLPKDARILEIGCGSRWVGNYLRANGWVDYTGADLVPPADIVGDIRAWRALGLVPASFDVVIAFEVIEHVDLVRDAYDLLKPGGQMLLTSPVPHMDWAMKLLERLGLNQRRTSPHSNLVYFDRIPLFEQVSLKRKAGLSQWGILRKPLAA
jgi:2-polyprenyl-3-methyl-5-hydroxy-6-metoxy-1,4-benzoquinol methylase